MSKNTEEIIIKTDDVRVRVLTLEPKESLSWHYHSEIVDHMFCLSGTIIIRLKGPEEQKVLLPGQHCEVAVGRVHQVANTTGEPVQYLLVQGVGDYDFNKVQI